MDTLRLLTRGSGLKLNNSSGAADRNLPSAGAQQEAPSISKKRKRSEIEKTGSSDEIFPEETIRKIQKEHKIRINDLKFLYQNDKSESRKAHKEKSRLFPQPLTKFAQLHNLNVNNRLIENIANQAYDQPTEVQVAAIPLLLRKDAEKLDLLTVAPTGSGKTLAYLIPLIDKISKGHQAQGDSKHVSSIILVPTRELVAQIVNEGRKLVMKTGVRVTSFRKGMKLHEDAVVSGNESSDGTSEDDEERNVSTVVKADIIVSTPLSFVHAINQAESSEALTLPEITNLIFDEADVLLDPLFREQTLSIWTACTNPDLRVSLWSATIGANTEELAIKTITDRQRKLRISRETSLLRITIGLRDSSLPNIRHKLVYASTEQGKLLGLRQLLHPTRSATISSSTSNKNATTSTSPPALRPPFLIFTQTIERATALHKELQYDIPPATVTNDTTNSKTTPTTIPRIAVLHSSLSSSVRTQTMTHFRQGKIWILITTDLLSRGMDFRGINGVVNYDIPTTAASYVHRAGRTGRAGREGGVCVTLYTREDIKYLKMIANVIKQSGSGKGSADPDSAFAKGGVPPWLINALPDLTKQDRKELKMRGVEVRRGVKKSDDKKQRRIKGKNRIGNASGGGYEKRVSDRRRGAVEGSKRRKEKERSSLLTVNTKQDADGDFEGFE